MTRVANYMQEWTHYIHVGGMLTAIDGELATTATITFNKLQLTSPNNIANVTIPYTYRYSFNGQERQDELYGSGNAYDFGARMYDSRIGRFFSTDPLKENFPFYSPYIFAGNTPITHIDFFGMGPKERVSYANSFLGTPYVQETGHQLRTGTDKVALAKIDCSELVCRVLAADGLIKLNQAYNTSGLIGLFSNGKWEKSNSPKVGDVFLWRYDGHGHTGIVTNVSDDGTKVTITHAKGKKYGTVTETYNISYFTGHNGWKGFFRPKNEIEVVDNEVHNKKIDEINKEIETLEMSLSLLEKKKEKLIKKEKDTNLIDLRIEIKKQQIESKKSQLNLLEK